MTGWVGGCREHILKKITFMSNPGGNMPRACLWDNTTTHNLRAPVGSHYGTKMSLNSLCWVFQKLNDAHERDPLSPGVSGSTGPAICSSESWGALRGNRKRAAATGGGSTSRTWHQQTRHNDPLLRTGRFHGKIQFPSLS